MGSSLRKCFSFPMCFTQGFPQALASEASLSWTASVTVCFEFNLECLFKAAYLPFLFRYSNNILPWHFRVECCKPL
jgi:hypothetical protein